MFGSLISTFKNLEFKNTICCAIVWLRCQKNGDICFLFLEFWIFSLKLGQKNILFVIGNWEHDPISFAKMNQKKNWPLSILIIPRRSRRDIVLASSVRPSVCPSVRPFRPSVRPEPYLSTYWSDLIHSWYKW